MTHSRVPVLPEEVMANIRNQRLVNSTSPPSKTIHVVMAIDESYAPHASVTITSALDCARHPSSLNFYVLEDGSLTNDTRKKLAKAAQEQIGFVTVDTQKLANLPLNREYISQATYYRLTMQTALPADINKIIYIDADTVVTDALELLWDIPLNGHPIGACADEGGRTQASRLGLSEKHLYFNAGVVVFNLTALREMDFESAVMAAFESNKEKITLQDQDILNLVFCENTQDLPLRWNANTRLYINNELEPAYSPLEALEAARAPAILHFTDRRKPWMNKDLNPLGYLYWYYRNQTPWRENLVETAVRRIKKSLRHVLSKSQRDLNAQIKKLRTSR